ncbi:MAG: 50S ribosomal protein L31 [Asticcacaulis sp.]|nr:50S ribosomal protein L31 [Asticcacaulis sp.]
MPHTFYGVRTLLAGRIKEQIDEKEGHPDYHWITVTLTDGSTYRTRSTYGKEDAVLNLDIDPRTHPAWTGGTGTLLDRGGRVSRFNNKFAGFLKK